MIPFLIVFSVMYDMLLSYLLGCFCSFLSLLHWCQWMCVCVCNFTWAYVCLVTILFCVCIYYLMHCVCMCVPYSFIIILCVRVSYLAILVFIVSILTSLHFLFTEYFNAFMISYGRQDAGQQWPKPRRIYIFVGTISEFVYMYANTKQ